MFVAFTGEDPGFFLGGGALFCCSTSTPINHNCFFCRIPVVLENRRSSQGVRTPCTLPLDPPLLYIYTSQCLKENFTVRRVIFSLRTDIGKQTITLAFSLLIIIIQFLNINVNTAT